MARTENSHFCRARSAHSVEAVGIMLVTRALNGYACPRTERGQARLFPFFLKSSAAHKCTSTGPLAPICVRRLAGARLCVAAVCGPGGLTVRLHNMDCITWDTMATLLICGCSCDLQLFLARRISLVDCRGSDPRPQVSICSCKYTDVQRAFLVLPL